MKLLPAAQNNIIHGQARIMGAITENDRKPAWILPGGRYTLNPGRAMEVAKRINRALSSRRR